MEGLRGCWKRCFVLVKELVAYSFAYSYYAYHHESYRVRGYQFPQNFHLPALIPQSFTTVKVDLVYLGSQFILARIFLGMYVRVY